MIDIMQDDGSFCNFDMYQKDIELIWKIIDQIELAVCRTIDLVKIEKNEFYDLLFAVFEDDNDAYLEWVNIKNKEEQKEKMKGFMPLLYENNISFKKLNNKIPFEIEPFYVYQLAISYTLTSLIKLEVLKCERYKKIPESIDIREFIPILHNYSMSISIAFGMFKQNSKNEELSKQNSIHSKGGKAKSKKNQIIKEELYKRYEQGNYHTYTKCAEELHSELGVTYSTIIRWLSEKYSKKEIK